MGFYVRKSLRAGPFRFNLSKSGIGVSAGVPGFRVGTGPRGNYVHLGRGGVYYRASLGGGSRRGGSSVGVGVGPGPGPAQLPATYWTPPPGSEVPMEDVTGASALELSPSGRGDIVEQLNEAAKRPRFARWALTAAIVLLFVKPPVGTILALLSIPFVVWLFMRDRAARAVVAFYDVNDDAARWFQRVVTAFEDTSKMSRRWRFNTTGKVKTTYQYKVNSGASTIVSRSALSVTMNGPKVLKTNIVIPSVVAGKNALHFLPDRLLVANGKRFSDVAYAELSALARNGRFIETESAPRDGVQVDTTWQYVNVKGGPDRRYKNNRQLPVMLYGELELTSDSGLSWLLQCSKSDGFYELARVLKGAPSALERSSEPAHADTARELPSTANGAESTDEFAPAAVGAVDEDDENKHVAVFEKAVRVRDDSDEERSVTVTEEKDTAAAVRDPGVGDSTSPVNTDEHAVPRTDAERARLIAGKPPAWEYLLYGSCLLAGQERLQPKWLDHQLGYTTRRGRELSTDRAMKMLTDALDEVQSHAANLMKLFSQTALEPAFGRPGESGDPELIEHLCRRFTAVYEALLDWAVGFRSARVPPLLQPVFETASHMVDRPLETIRSFVNENVAELDRLPERLRHDEEIKLVMTLTLEVDDAVMHEFEQRMATASAGF
jgi:hypothetical protein